MEITQVIIRPLVSEKSLHLQTTRNAYAFQVHQGANKHQIKQAVESLYQVKVTDVRTMNRKGKPRRSKTKMTKASDWKRAIVVLDENSKIDVI